MTDENELHAHESMHEEPAFQMRSARDSVVSELSEITKIMEDVTEQLANNNPVTVIFAYEYSDGKTQTSTQKFVGVGSRNTMMGLTSNLQRQIGG